MLNPEHIRKIIESNSSDSIKIKRINGLIENKHKYVTDTGLGFLVRVPRHSSKLFRYVNEDKQVILNYAIKYRNQLIDEINTDNR